MSDFGEQVPMQWMTLDDVYSKTVSYAQNYEDILLGRVLPMSEGFYLDVGANHPVFHSVTKLFSERGWRGINIEPTPSLHRLLEVDRPRDINLNVGIGAADGNLTFYEATSLHGWSTFRPDLADHYRNQGVPISTRSVPVTTLAKVCDQHVDRTIDFLKIDAEGFEREVLLGADFSRWRPRVVLIENAWPEIWESLFDGIAYRLAAFDGINRYYVRHEDESLLPAFAATANALDNFIPYEYVRLFRMMKPSEVESNSTVINGLKGSVRRVVRKLRSGVRRLKSQAG